MTLQGRSHLEQKSMFMKQGKSLAGISPFSFKDSIIRWSVKVL